MANIVWSFGIALEAEDRTQEPIDAFADRLKALDKRMKELEESTRTSVDAASSLAKAEENVGKSVKIVGESVDKTKTLFGTFEHTVSNVVEGSIIALGKFASIAFNAPMLVAQGFINLLQSIPNTIAKWVFGKELDGLARDLTDAYQATQRFLDLGNNFGPIDNALRQLNAQMGGTKGQADSLIRGVIEIGANTGYTTSQVSELAVSLGRIGQNITALSEDKIKVLGHLANLFGLGADETIRMYGATQRLGINVEDLAEKASNFGKKFGIPDLMHILPEVTNMAADSIRRFGKNVVGDQRQLVDSTIKTAAIYAKAFGKDIREATGLAQQSFERFAGAAQHNSDLMLGLADDVDPMGMALLQAGASWQSMNDIIKSGTEGDTVQAAQQIKSLTDGITDLAYKTRIMRQLQMTLPAETYEMIVNEQRLKDAIDERSRATNLASIATSEGGKSFDNLVKGMRGTFNTARGVFEAIKGSIEALLGSIFTEAMTPVFESLTTHLIGFSKSIRTTIDTLTTNPAFKAVKETFQGIATILVGAGEAAGALASSLFGLETFLSILTPLNTGLQIFKNLISGAPGAAAKSFTELTHSLFAGVTLFGTFSKTAREVSEIFGTSGTFLAKFDATFRAVMGNFADYMDSFFLGLPSKMIQSFTKGTVNEKATFRSAIMGLMDFAYVAIKDQLSVWSREIPINLNETWGKVGDSLGSQLGSIARKVSDFIRNLFSPSDQRSLIERFRSIFTGFGAEEGTISASLYTIGQKLLSGVKGFVSEFFDGFLGEFGTNTDLFVREISLKFSSFGLTIKETFFYILEQIKVFSGPITSVVSAINGAISKARDLIEGSTESLNDQYGVAAQKLREFDKQYEKYTTPEENWKQRVEPWVLKERAELEKTIKVINDKIGVRSKEAEQSAIMERRLRDLANSGSAEKLNAARADLEQQQSKLEYEKEKFKLINSVLKGEKDVSQALNEAATSKRFELIPEIMKAAFDRQKKSADEAKVAQAALNNSFKAGEEPATAAARSTQTTSSDDIRSNYEKVADAAGKDYARVWLFAWQVRDFKDPMPPIPPGESKSAGASATSPASVAPPVSLDAGEKTTGSLVIAASRTAEPKPAVTIEDLARSIAETIQAAMAQMNQKDKPVSVDIHIDPEGMNHVIKTFLNGQQIR